MLPFMLVFEVRASGLKAVARIIELWGFTAFSLFHLLPRLFWALRTVDFVMFEGPMEPA